MTKTICPVFLQEGAAYKEELHALESCPCDVIEIRLDPYYPAHTLKQTLSLLEESLAMVSKPLLYTLRTKEEGGNSEVSQEDYEALIAALYTLKGITDIQLHRMPIKDYRPKKSLLSYHNFSCTPDRQALQALWQAMEAWKPAIEKMALMPRSFQDVLLAMEACKSHVTASQKILISMSGLGLVSRLEGNKCQSDYTFCTLNTSSAPGQVPLADFLEWKRAL